MQSAAATRSCSRQLQALSLGVVAARLYSGWPGLVGQAGLPACISLRARNGLLKWSALYFLVVLVVLVVVLVVLAVVS